MLTALVFVIGSGLLFLVLIYVMVKIVEENRGKKKNHDKEE